jgi:hypothetical protein
MRVEKIKDIIEKANKGEDVSKADLLAELTWCVAFIDTLKDKLDIPQVRSREPVSLFEEGTSG